MYLKLGNTNIKYSTNQDDFTILSQVVNSGLSYEKPIFVRTPDELSIWFGNNFIDKEYFDELLSSGITLFLYKPINSKENIYSDGYIDLSEYTVDPKIYDTIDYLPEYQEGSKIKYKVLSENGEFEENNVNYSYYIYIKPIGYTKVSELPQNIDTNNTMSLNNRDTLDICYPEYIGPSYNFPIYRENEFGTISKYPEEDNIDKDLLLNHLPDLEKISLKYQTLGFSYIYNNLLNFFPEDEQKLESKYIIVKKLNPETNKLEDILVWFKYENSVIPSIPSQYYKSVISIDLESLKDNKNVFDYIAKEIFEKELGYIVEKISDTEYKIYFSYSIDVTNFNNIPGFYLEPDFYTTHNILSSLNKNSKRISFISKTIGTDNDDTIYQDSDISINIKKLNSKDKYRITIKRYEYTEIFEGGVFTTGEDRIDDIITQQSKLVRCNIVRTYIDDDNNEIEYKEDWKSTNTRRSDLPEGTWYLKRAVKENYSIEYYWKSFNSIVNSEQSRMIDFFLIPDIYKYTNGIISEYSYYPEYLTLLDTAKKLNIQILIQNSDNGWTYKKVDNLPNINEAESNTVYILETEQGATKFYILVNEELTETVDPEIINTYGNNYIFNYIEDLDNRLIYFLRPITIYGNLRPGYYIFLLSVLEDTYSVSTSKIIYDTPTSKPYEDESIEENLEKYKTNYLVYNNHMYYYKKYQNGENFNTSIWMRFCIGKVNRELEKNKWDIISTKSVGTIRSKVETILAKISNSYSFIDSLMLTGLYIDLPNNRVGIEIESRMSDLVNNNMEIDITLNYDKNNN